MRLLLPWDEHVSGVASGQRDHLAPAVLQALPFSLAKYVKAVAASEAGVSGMTQLGPLSRGLEFLWRVVQPPEDFM